MENKNKKCASVDGDEKFGDYYLSMGTTGRIVYTQPAGGENCNLRELGGLKSSQSKTELIAPAS